MSFTFNFSSPDSQGEESASQVLNIDPKDSSHDCTNDPVDLTLTSIEPTQEISINEAHVEDLDEYEAGHCLELPSGQLLGYVDVEAVEKWICSHGSVHGKSTQLGSALKTDSDLVPNVYEGGLKIWECSVDLVQFLASSDIDFVGKKVLELGCGAGLPGIYAQSHGAEVHFQDYNWEVLDFITIPNVLLNTVYKDKLQSNQETQDSTGEDSDSDGTDDDMDKSETVPLKKQKVSDKKDSDNADEKTTKKKNSRLKFINKSKKESCDINISSTDSELNTAESRLNEDASDKNIDGCDKLASDEQENQSVNVEEVKKSCSFFAGDWQLLTEMLGDRKQRYDIILTSETIYSVSSYGKLLDVMEKLLTPDGIVYLAAKTYYFGVGGGTRSFEEFVRKADVFDIKQRVVFSEGLQREILQLNFKK